MRTAFFLTAPILLPIVFGLLLGILRGRRQDSQPMPSKPGNGGRRCPWLVILALALNVPLVLAAALNPGLRLIVIRLTDRLPILFISDGMGAFFCVLTAFVYLLAGTFSLEYMKHEENAGRFYMFFLFSLGMLNGIGLAGNLMTLYLFFEALTLLSLPLVIHAMTKEAIAATFKYLFYSMAGTSLALVGFFFVYNYGHTLEFGPGSALDMASLVGHENAMLTAILLAVIGFGAKAGMFPLHSWLPAAHPVAPAPASAILSGIITKAGAFAVIRFVFYLVGPDFLRGTWAQSAWMALALISIVMGSMLAYRETMFKTRLAYSSISQVSYVLFGLSMLSADGMLGAMLHMAGHSLVKSALFLSAGAVAYRTQKTAVSELRGIGRQMPLTLGCFTLAAITLVGIPPTSGFISKWFLATGSLAGTGFFSWLGPVILLLSALLTAGYLLPISISGFFPGSEANQDREANLGHEMPLNRNAEPEKKEANALITAPLVVLVVLAVLIGIYPGILISFISKTIGAIF